MSTDFGMALHAEVGDAFYDGGAGVVDAVKHRLVTVSRDICKGD